MLIGNEPMDLRLTLMDSAQCFRWTQTGDRYACAMADGPVWLWRTERGVEAEGVKRCVCDYLSCMTDRYAIELFHELFVPEVWRIK